MLHLRLLILLPLIFSTACSMIPNMPDGERWSAAAKKAASAKRTWVPLAVAAAWSIDDYDQQTADWAKKHTPVFGSTREADSYSFKMLDAMMIGAVGTSFFLPVENNTEHGMVTLGTMGTTALTTVRKTAAWRRNSVAAGSGCLRRLF